jgi:hypothetical protein
MGEASSYQLYQMYQIPGLFACNTSSVDYLSSSDLEFKMGNLQSL